MYLPNRSFGIGTAVAPLLHYNFPVSVRQAFVIRVSPNGRQTLFVSDLLPDQR
jgi:hypothetical protein